MLPGPQIKTCHSCHCSFRSKTPALTASEYEWQYSFCEAHFPLSANFPCAIGSTRLANNPLQPQENWFWSFHSEWIQIQIWINEINSVHDLCVPAGQRERTRDGFYWWLSRPRIGNHSLRIYGFPSHMIYNAKRDLTDFGCRNWCLHIKHWLICLRCHF